MEKQDDDDLFNSGIRVALPMTKDNGSAKEEEAAGYANGKHSVHRNRQLEQGESP
jgi:hypothetical protein